MQTTMLEPTLFGRFAPNQGAGMLGLRTEFDRLFDQFLGPAGRTGGFAAWTPPVNVWEDADELYVEAELPGLALDDIELTLEREQLTIRGTRFEPGAEQHEQRQQQPRQEAQQRQPSQKQPETSGARPDGRGEKSGAANGAWLHRERPSGRFERSITLPLPVDVESVEARLEHGVLTVRLPKAQAVRARKIQVQKA